MVYPTTSESYERHGTHVASIKLMNNHYGIPATLKFDLSSYTHTINDVQRHVVIFQSIKIINLSAVVTSSKETTLHLPKKILLV